ncbi:hypothetical protein LCGC14_1659240 [marine sediment metagenome]|uniref:Uncharacterized protein n=1 Tax=marine sediment metagenome TaxID=412755 RepID=A0A0F9IH46_9ZZZZ
MSRAGATVGAFGGSVIGAMGGLAAGGYLADRKRERPGYDYDPDDASATISVVGMLGTGLGGMIGAAIGAGSSKPKQITAGVGALPSNMGGGMFP